MVLSEIILDVAKRNLDKEVLLILRDSQISDEPRPGTSVTSVTWRRFLADVRMQIDSISHTTGRAPRAPREEAFVVGLLAQNGYNYLVNLMAMIMMRWTVLLISPRNSKDAVRHLMHSTCSRFLLADTIKDDEPSGVSPQSYTTFTLPVHIASSRNSFVGIEDWLNSISVPEFHNLDSETCLILHTSGTTGHPKPVAWTHSFLSSLILAMKLDRGPRRGQVIYTPLPLYHGGGISVSLPNILGTGSILALIDSRNPVSADLVLSHINLLKDRDIDVFLTPSILEDMFDSDKLERRQIVRILLYTNAIVWGGAPLRQDVGDYFSSNRVRLVSWGGITEAGVFARSLWDSEGDPSDWPYFRLVDSYEFKFMPLDERNLSLGYRVIIAPNYCTPPVINTENPRGFLTSDVWHQHPDPKKAHLWRITGRVDDVTVLSNGEKTDNKQLESLLTESPLISCAIVFGSGKPFNGVLLLPARVIGVCPGQTGAGFLENVWRHINNRVNRTVPRHSQIIHPLVIIASPEKPFLCSDKATIRREETLRLYEQEINAAYNCLYCRGDGEAPVASLEQPVLTEKDYIDLVGLSVASIHGAPLETDRDFFDSGFDSLRATKLRFDVISRLKSLGYSSSFPRNMVYRHPTTTLLARFIQMCCNAPGDYSMNDTLKVDHATIDDMINKYSRDFPIHRPELPPNPNNGCNVYVATGTTGSLGSALASALLRTAGVRTIYLINRVSSKATIEHRHKKMFGNLGLDFDELSAAVSSGKAVYVEIDYGDKRLGLDEDMYRKVQLAEDVTHIIHVAWRVSLNLTLSSFEGQIAGLRHLIDLALSSRRHTPPCITFLSSVAVVGRWTLPCQPHEEPLPSADFALPHGYAYGKYISEKILERAVVSHPDLFRAIIVRSGQISGSLNTGAWSRDEYLPTLLRLSVELGVIPNASQAVRWLPVDIAARIVVKLSQWHGPQLSIFHMENNVELPWSAVIRAIKSSRTSLNSETQLVSLYEWVERAKQQRLGSDSESSFVLMDLMNHSAFPFQMPTLNTMQVTLVVGDLLSYRFGEDLLRRYVDYSCSEGD